MPDSSASLGPAPTRPLGREPAPASAPSDAPELLADPIALWQRISARIDERLQIVERSVVLLLERSLRAEEIATCRDECTLIAKWVFALDLPIAGRIMREVGSVMERSTSDDSEQLSSRDASGLAVRIQDFRTVIRVSGDDWLDHLPSSGHVHVVSLIDARVDALMWHLRKSGVSVTHTQRFAGSPPDADAMVLFWDGPIADTEPALAEIGRRSWTTRRILIHNADQPCDGLAAVSPRADVLLSIGEAPDVLAAEIRSIVLPDATWIDRVVVYGGEDLADELRRYHFTPILVHDLEAIAELLSSSDLTLVVGADVAEPSEIAAFVRATPRIRESVIAVQCVDAVSAAKCRQLGADIIIENGDDIDAWALQLRGLVTRRNRARRVEQIDRVEIASWSSTMVVFERALGSLGRTAGKAALALVRLPNDLSDEALATMRHAVAIEFRSVDLLGLSEEGLLMVLLRGATREAASARLLVALEHLEIPQTPGRVGVAEFPIDGYGLGELMVEAGRAADRSAEAEGPAVTPSDWRSEQARQADVVLVESDHTLASILSQLLDQIGLTSEHLLTGSDALKRFTSGDGNILPRLLIIELDAMGADGLMVLRSLARHGVLSRTKVLVTCARIRDGELREAFELGADDVVVKPFSAVVLSNRIEQVLLDR